MHISEVFVDQARVEAQQLEDVEQGITFLCFDAGSQRLALPLEQAREVVENPVVVGYPMRYPRHVGIANVRGTVVPVLRLSDELTESTHLVVFDSTDGAPFSLLVCGARTVTVADGALADTVHSDTAVTGVARIDGKPLRWVTVRWLESEFSEAV